MQAPAEARPATFRVHFQGGATVFVTANNALKAEQKARRTTPGIVVKVQFIGRKSQ